MTTTRILAQPPTARTLPPLLSAQERMARCCHDCGRAATVYWLDELTPLCGKCWMERYEGIRAC
jgi:hypothetical protein